MAFNKPLMFTLIYTRLELLLGIVIRLYLAHISYMSQSCLVTLADASTRSKYC